MKTFRKILSTALLVVIAFVAHAQTGALERATPESQGVRSNAMIEFFDSLNAIPMTDMHSVIVMRHGKVIGEMYPAPFGSQYKHTLYSGSKTFTAAAVGLAINDNRLRLDDRVAVFFPDELPDSVSDDLAAMTVRDLLTMASGVKPDWVMRSKRPDWIRGFLEKPVDKPGTNFQYDSMVTYMLSAIVTKVTGKTVLELLKERVFGPMGITDVAWELSPEGNNTGGWGLLILPEDMAKFGQLLLNRGNWHGKQLLPADWVDAMTTKQIDAREYGYGYQTWPCEYRDAYRADGALGQYIIVSPEKDMVVVITEATLGNGIPPRDCVWMLMDTVSDTPLPESKDIRQLDKTTSTASLALPKGKKTAPCEKKIDGMALKLDSNPFGWESIKFNFDKQTLDLRFRNVDFETFDIEAGYGRWLTSEIEAYPPYSITPVGRFTGIEKCFHVGAAYAWKSKNTLDITMHYVDWVTSLHLHITFDDNGDVSLTVDTNYSKKPVEIRAYPTTNVKTRGCGFLR